MLFDPGDCGVEALRALTVGKWAPEAQNTRQEASLARQMKPVILGVTSIMAADH